MPVPNTSLFTDRILACLTNGVVTIDSSDLITTWNPATANILQMEPSLALGRRYQDVFRDYSQLGLIGLLSMARIQRTSGIAQTTVEGIIPGRGPVNLVLLIDVLKDSRLNYLGMTALAWKAGSSTPPCQTAPPASWERPQLQQIGKRIRAATYFRTNVSGVA